jgi:hypothetical protein
MPTRKNGILTVFCKNKIISYSTKNKNYFSGAEKDGNQDFIPVFYLCYLY